MLERMANRVPSRKNFSFAKGEYHGTGLVACHETTASNRVAATALKNPLHNGAGFETRLGHRELDIATSIARFSWPSQPNRYTLAAPYGRGEARLASRTRHSADEVRFLLAPPAAKLLRIAFLLKILSCLRSWVG